MKKQLTKFALSAGIMLAMAFTFSCSGGDGGNEPSGGGTSSPSGGGSFTENTQVYNKDGSLYTGSGIIKIRWTGSNAESLLNAGSVTNGIVNLQLPQTIPSEYLHDFMKAEQQSLCTDYPNGIKGLFDDDGYIFALVNSSSYDIIGVLRQFNIQGMQGMFYWYFSIDGKITCNFTNSESDVVKINIDAKTGWNKIYAAYAENQQVYSTNNILTKEVRWTLK